MESKPNAYQKVTTSLTPKQHQWVRQVAAKAQLEGLSINAADVIRLALDRLQEQLSEQELRDALVTHVLKEAKNYPGRAKRGLPKEPR
jgi:uncharacterized protein (DUF2267 family)